MGDVPLLGDSDPAESAPALKWAMFGQGDPRPWPRRPEHRQAAASAGPPSAPAAADQHRVQAHRPRGARPGAGRPRIRRSRVAHRSRGAVPAHCSVLVTLRVLDDVPALRRACFVRAFRETLRKAARRLANGMKSLAARFARCVNRVFSRRGRVLADRFHHVLKRTPTEVRRALAYVLLNARKRYDEKLVILFQQVSIMSMLGNPTNDHLPVSGGDRRPQISR